MGSSVSNNELCKYSVHTEKKLILIQKEYCAEHQISICLKFELFTFCQDKKKSNSSPCIWHVLVPLSGHINGGRAKGAKAHMSMQTVIFNKAALRGERKKKNLAGHAYKSYSWDVCLG